MQSTKRFLSLAAAAVCLLLAVNLSAQTAPSGAPAAHPEMLVSTQWLADHLNDPKVVVIETGDKPEDNYTKRHIPGARFLGNDDYVVGHVGVMWELPPVEKLKAAFEKLGVSDDSRIVIYTQDWYPNAARVYYTLDYLGLGDRAALLDGNGDKWAAEKRPISNEEPKITPGHITPKVNEHVRALLAQVKTASQPNSGTTLADSRPKDRYEAGHISGAENIFWEQTVVEPKGMSSNLQFKSPDELRKLFASHGMNAGAKVITYCEVGIQASHNYFVAKYIGLDPQMYDGSDYEWERVEKLPVVKGDAKR